MCQQGPFDVKQDIPFANDGEIGAMVEQFEACRWPFIRWSHRCHLAAGAWYLRHWPYEVALEKVRGGIQLYNRTCGTGDGYNDTITQLFLRTIHERLGASNNGESLVALVDELARTRTMAWVREHYSKERLASRGAIDGWVEPDLKPLTL